VVNLGLEGLTETASLRTSVVIQDDLLIQGLQLHHITPKNLRA
jgi:hypothetical protein